MRKLKHEGAILTDLERHRLLQRGTHLRGNNAQPRVVALNDILHSNTLESSKRLVGFFLVRPSEQPSSIIRLLFPTCTVIFPCLRSCTSAGLLIWHMALSQLGHFSASFPKSLYQECTSLHYRSSCRKMIYVVLTLC